MEETPKTETKTADFHDETYFMTERTGCVFAINNLSFVSVNIGAVQQKVTRDVRIEQQECYKSS